MKGTPPTQTAHAATHRTVCYVHLYEEHLHLIGRLARPPLPAPRTRFRPFQRNQRPPPRAPLPRRPQQTLSRRAPRDNARDAPPHGAGARSRFPPPPRASRTRPTHRQCGARIKGQTRERGRVCAALCRARVSRCRPANGGRTRPGATGRAAHGPCVAKKKKETAGKTKNEPCSTRCLVQQGGPGDVRRAFGPPLPASE